MMLPRLHLVTDDALLAEPGFLEHAERALATGGPAVALHVRGHQTTAATLQHIAERLAVAALRAGSWLLVNDRVDIALAVRAHGAQLGMRSLPLARARMLLGPRAQLGYSAHSAPEAAQAAADGADFLFVGTIYRSPSHAERTSAGVDTLRECATRAALPVLAIGGITPQRIRDVAAAGGYGVAVLSGVWRSADTVRALSDYSAAIREVWQ